MCVIEIDHTINAKIVLYTIFSELTLYFLHNIYVRWISIDDSSYYLFIWSGSIVIWVTNRKQSIRALRGLIDSLHVDMNISFVFHSLVNLSLYILFQVVHTVSRFLLLNLLPPVQEAISTMIVDTDTEQRGKIEQYTVDFVW